MTLFRLKIRWSAFKHRLLCWCSESFRDHDAVMRKLSMARDDRSALEAKLIVATRELSECRSQLNLSNEAQQNATAQLIAERALREAADERAERYHEELVSTLKQTNNWSALAVSRKPIFRDIATPEPEPAIDKPIEAIRPKAMARQVASDITQKTVTDWLNELRGAETPHVGPEFTTQ